MENRKRIRQLPERRSRERRQQAAKPEQLQVFEPIRTYLQREYYDEPERILTYLIYRGCKEGVYYYRNKVTRSLIAVDEEGQLVSGWDNALHTLYSYRTEMQPHALRKNNTGAPASNE